MPKPASRRKSTAETRIPTGATRWRTIHCGPDAEDAARARDPDSGFLGDLVQDTRPEGVTGYLLAAYQHEALTDVFALVEGSLSPIACRFLRLVARSPDQTQDIDPATRKVT
jgi:hypothetical protein